MAVKGVATFFVILAVLACVDAHTIFSSISVGGVAQPDGDCMRPQASANKDSPIATVTSPDMTCGFLPNAANPANRKCPVAAGSKVGLQWWHYTPGDDIIADSHKGPCIVYLAKSDTGAGNVWFKIYEDGYNENTKQWCVDKLIANRGYFEVTIPGDISPGNYLLRGEVIALHGAHEKGGSQPYVHCAELTISGTGTANPAGVALPGAYTENDPGIFINIYYPAVKNYIIPGPAVYQPSSTPTSAPTPAPSGGVTNAPTPAPTSAPTATRAPAPSGNIVAYDDAIKAPFEDWSWAKDITVSATSVKQAGSASLRFKPQSYQAAYFYCAGCIDTTKHSAIEFWINGGNAGGQSVNFNLLKGTEKSGADLSVNKYTGATSIQANTWVKGTVQLSGFTAGVYDGFWFQDSSGTTTQGDVYVDSITVLAKANTGSPTPAPTNPDGTTPTPVVPSSSTTDGTNKLIDNSAVVATPTLMLVLVALLALLL